MLTMIACVLATFALGVLGHGTGVVLDYIDS